MSNITVYLNGSVASPRFAYGIDTDVYMENHSPEPIEVEFAITCRAFKSLFLKKGSHHIRLPLNVPEKVIVPPGRSIVFPDVMIDELEEYYTHLRDEGYTVAPVIDGGAIPVIRIGEGTVPVLIITRFQPEETTGTFMVQGIVDHLLSQGIPEHVSFYMIIEPDQELIASGPGGRVPLFNPQGDSAAEQEFKAVIDTIKPELYINLHDWSTRHPDGFYTVDGNLWIEEFIRLSRKSDLYAGEWDITAKQYAPRVSPYPKPYSIGEESALYAFIEHSALAVYGEFPWDRRTPAQIRELGGVFIQNMLEVFDSYGPLIKAFSAALSLWRSDGDENKVKGLFEEALAIAESSLTDELSERAQCIIELAYSRFKAYQAWQKKVSFPQEAYKPASKRRIGIYDPGDRYGMVNGVPLIRSLVREEGGEGSVVHRLSEITLATLDGLIIPAVQYMGLDDGTGLYELLIKAVTEDGLNLLLYHDSCGQAHSFLSYSLFPAICEGALFYDDYEIEDRAIISTGTLMPQEEYSQSCRWKKHLRPGPDGTVEAIDKQENALIISGAPGKGRVLYCGMMMSDYASGPAVFPDGDLILEQSIIRGWLKTLGE